MDLIRQVIVMYSQYDFETEVLVASARHPVHVVLSAEMGADVITLPFKTLGQLYRHPLTDIGLNQFLADWEKTGRSFDD